MTNTQKFTPKQANFMNCSHVQANKPGNNVRTAIDICTGHETHVNKTGLSS